MAEVVFRLRLDTKQFDAKLKDAGRNASPVGVKIKLDLSDIESQVAKVQPKIQLNLTANLNSIVGRIETFLIQSTNKLISEIDKLGNKIGTRIEKGVDKLVNKLGKGGIVGRAIGGVLSLGTSIIGGLVGALGGIASSIASAVVTPVIKVLTTGIDQVIREVAKDFYRGAEVSEGVKATGRKTRDFTQERGTDFGNVIAQELLLYEDGLKGVKKDIQELASGVSNFLRPEPFFKSIDKIETRFAKFLNDTFYGEGIGKAASNLADDITQPIEKKFKSLQKVLYLSDTRVGEQLRNVSSGKISTKDLSEGSREIYKRLFRKANTIAEKEGITSPRERRVRAKEILKTPSKTGELFSQTAEDLVKESSLEKLQRPFNVFLRSLRLTTNSIRKMNAIELDKIAENLKDTYLDLVPSIQETGKNILNIYASAASDFGRAGSEHATVIQASIPGANVVAPTFEEYYYKRGTKATGNFFTDFPNEFVKGIKGNLVAGAEKELKNVPKRGAAAIADTLSGYLFGFSKASARLLAVRKAAIEKGYQPENIQFSGFSQGSQVVRNAIDTADLLKQEIKGIGIGIGDYFDALVKPSKNYKSIITEQDALNLLLTKGVGTSNKNQKVVNSAVSGIDGHAIFQVAAKQEFPEFLKQSGIKGYRTEQNSNINEKKFGLILQDFTRLIHPLRTVLLSQNIRQGRPASENITNIPVNPFEKFIPTNNFKSLIASLQSFRQQLSDYSPEKIAKTSKKSGIPIDPEFLGVANNVVNEVTTEIQSLAKQLGVEGSTIEKSLANLTEVEPAIDIYQKTIEKASTGTLNFAETSAQIANLISSLPVGNLKLAFQDVAQQLNDFNLGWINEVRNDFLESARNITSFTVKENQFKNRPNVPNIIAPVTKLSQEVQNLANKQKVESLGAEASVPKSLVETSKIPNYSVINTQQDLQPKILALVPEEIIPIDLNKIISPSIKDSSSLTKTTDAAASIIAKVTQTAAQKAENLIVSKVNQLLTRIPGQPLTLEGNPKQIAKLSELQQPDYLKLAGLGAYGGLNLAKGAINTAAIPVKIVGQVAKGAESVALDLIPGGRTIKSGIQNFALPAAAFGATTQLPGGQVVAELATTLAHQLVNPIANAVGTGISEAASSGINQALAGTGFIGKTIAPHLVSNVTGAISNLTTTSVSAIAEIGTAVLGGRAILGTGSNIGKSAIKAVLPSNNDPNIKSLSSSTLSDQTTKVLNQRIKAIEIGTKNALIQFKQVAQSFENAGKQSKKLQKLEPSKAQDHIKAIFGNYERTIAEIDNAIASLSPEERLSTKQGNQLANLKSRVVKAKNSAERLARKIQETVSKPLDTIDTALHGGAIRVNATVVDDSESTGKNIVSGLAKGVSDNAKSADKSATDLASGIIETTKDVLDIQSPSGEFEKIGEDVVKGLKNGIDGLEDVLGKDAARKIESGLNTIKKTTSKQIPNLAQRQAEFENLDTGLKDRLNLIESELPQIPKTSNSQAKTRIKLPAEITKSFESTGKFVENLPDVLASSFTNTLSEFTKIQNQISGKFKNIESKIRKTPANVSTGFTKFEQNLFSAKDKVRTNIQSSFRSGIAVVANSFNELTAKRIQIEDVIINFVKDIPNNYTKIVKSAQNELTKIPNKISQLATSSIDTSKALFTDAIVNSFDQINAKGIQVENSIIDFAENIPRKYTALVSSAQNQLNNIATQTSSQIKSVGNNAKRLAGVGAKASVNTVVNSFLKLVDTYIAVEDNIVGFRANLSENYVASIKSTQNELSNISTQTSTAFNSTIDFVRDIPKNYAAIINSAQKQIIDISIQVPKTLNNIRNSAKTGLKNAPRLAFDSFSKGAKSLGKAIHNAPTTIEDLLNSARDQIDTTKSQISTSITSIKTNARSGIGNIIKTASGKFNNAVTTLAQSIKNAVTTNKDLVDSASNQINETANQVQSLANQTKNRISIISSGINTRNQPNTNTQTSVLTTQQNTSPPPPKPPTTNSSSSQPDDSNDPSLNNQKLTNNVKLTEIESLYASFKRKIDSLSKIVGSGVKDSVKTLFKNITENYSGASIDTIRRQAELLIDQSSSISPNLQPTDKSTKKLGVFTQKASQLNALPELDEKQIKALQVYNSEIKKILVSLGQKPVTNPFADFDSGITGLITKGAVLLKGFIAFQAVNFLQNQFSQLGREAFEASLRFESLKTTLNFSSSSAVQGGKNLAFVRGEVERLSTPLEASIRGFTQLSATTRNTQLEGEATKDIFSALSQAALVFGLSGDQIERANTAIVQIASKGVVSLEELRQQLSEAIPGAVQIAARAMNLTERELYKLIETGNLAASDFLPKFARQLSLETNSGVAGAANTARAAVNKFNNSVLSLQVGLGEAISPSVTQGINLLSGGLNFLGKNASTIIGLASSLSAVILGSLTVSFVKSGLASALLSKSLVALGAASGTPLKAQLLSIGTSLATLGVQAIALFAAMKAGEFAFKLFTRQGGDMEEFADRAEAALKRIQTEAKKTQDQLNGLAPDKSKEDRATNFSDFYEARRRNAVLEARQKGNSRFVDIFNPFSDIRQKSDPFSGILAFKERNDRREATKEGLKQYDEIGKLATDFIKFDDKGKPVAQSGFQEILDIDKKINEKSFLRAAVPKSDTKRYADLQREIDGLSKKRRELEGTFTAISSGISQGITDIEKKIEEETDPVAKKLLEDKLVNLKKFRDGLGSLQNQGGAVELAKKFAETMFNLSDALAQATRNQEQFLVARKIAANTKLADTLTRDPLAEQKVVTQGIKDQKEALENQLKDREQVLANARTAVNNPLFEQAFKQSNISNTTTIEQLQRTAKDASDPKIKVAIEALIRLREEEENTTQVRVQLTDTIVQAQQDASQAALKEIERSNAIATASTQQSTESRIVAIKNLQKQGVLAEGAAANEVNKIQLDSAKQSLLNLQTQLVNLRDNQSKISAAEFEARERDLLTQIAGARRQVIEQDVQATKEMLENQLSDIERVYGQTLSVLDGLRARGIVDEQGFNENIISLAKQRANADLKTIADARGKTDNPLLLKQYDAKEGEVFKTRQQGIDTAFNGEEARTTAHYDRLIAEQDKYLSVGTINQKQYNRQTRDINLARLNEEQKLSERRLQETPGDADREKILQQQANVSKRRLEEVKKFVEGEQQLIDSHYTSLQASDESAYNQGTLSFDEFNKRRLNSTRDRLNEEDRLLQERRALTPAGNTLELDAIAKAEADVNNRRLEGTRTFYEEQRKFIESGQKAINATNDANLSQGVITEQEYYQQRYQNNQKFLQEQLASIREQISVTPTGNVAALNALQEAEAGVQQKISENSAQFAKDQNNLLEQSIERANRAVKLSETQRETDAARVLNLYRNNVDGQIKADQIRLQSKITSNNQEIESERKRLAALRELGSKLTDPREIKENEGKIAQSQQNIANFTLERVKQEGESQELAKRDFLRALDVRNNAQKIASNAIILNLTREKTAQEALTRSIESQSNLLKSRGELQKSQSDLNEFRASSAVDIYSKALEIRKRLDEDKNINPAVKTALQGQLQSLVGSSQVTTEQLVTAKQTQEDALAGKRLESLQRQQEIERSQLALDIQRNQLAVQREATEARITQLKATQEILDARRALAEAELTGDADQKSFAQNTLDIALLTADAARQQREDAEKQVAIQREINENSKSNLAVQQELTREQFAATEADRKRGQILERVESTLSRTTRLGSLLNIRQRFKGGDIQQGQATLVGEDPKTGAILPSTELFIPRTSGRILSAKDTQRVLAPTIAKMVLQPPQPTDSNKTVVRAIKDLQKIVQERKPINQNKFEILENNNTVDKIMEIQRKMMFQKL